MTPARALLLTTRPHQWVKNLFVAAPLVFSRHLGDGVFALRTAVAVTCFCLLSGAVYAFNDVRDVEADRAHPQKCSRPIAAGALSERAALIAAAVLARLRARRLRRAELESGGAGSGVRHPQPGL
jgi:decaprenyl-phosphate phosphoribosyltransferase